MRFREITAEKSDELYRMALSRCINRTTASWFIILWITLKVPRACEKAFSLFEVQNTDCGQGTAEYQFVAHLHVYLCKLGLGLDIASHVGTGPRTLHPV